MNGKLASLEKQGAGDMQSIVRRHPVLELNASILVGCVLFLIFMGALVKSNEAGLAVPDWPSSYGYNMFLFPPSLWIEGIWYEHVHRLIASGVGALTVILAFFLWRAKKLRLLGVAAVVLVLIQGLLGGLTVLYGLPDIVSVAHGVTAQAFLVLTVLISFLLSSEAREENKKLFQVGLVATLLVFLQLVLGAFMRHSESGLAIPDFPTMGGTFFPVFDEQMLLIINQMRSSVSLPAVSIGQVLIHFSHRVMAVVVLGSFLILGYRTFKLDVSSKTRRLAGYCLFAVFIQVCLGIIAVMSVRDPELTSLHVVLGAVLLALSFLFTMSVSRTTN